MSKSSGKTVPALSVTLIKSLSGRLANHKACAKGLGLRRISQTILVAGTPENLGMIKTIQYLLKVEEVTCN